MNYKTSKQNLRLQVNQKISKLSQQKKINKCKKIVRNLKEICKNLQYKNILIFDPLKDEPDISKFYNFLLFNKNSLYYPHMKYMKFINYQDYYSKNSKDKFNNNFRIFHTVFIPGRAFTTSGKRLGRGIGWYDRILDKCNLNIQKIGVCFSEQIFDDIPTQIHDKKVDRVIYY